MLETVALPVWLFLLLVLLASWTLIFRVILPAVRWWSRRRAEAALAEFEPRLLLRIRPFQLTRRQVLIDRLVFDAEVVEAARRHAQQNDLSQSRAQAEVEAYAEEIVPAFNAYVYFRIGYWIARRLSRSLFRVRLASTDRQGLAGIPAGAAVVFVMNHRSNMDYILVSHLAAEESALSYAVGEWARIWPLEQLIRAMGAYFVRRRSRNDLYRKVLERYVHMATAEGVTQAVFPEGRLSRDGALQPPKLGLLDYMLRSFDPQGDRDLVFVPVGINYDRVLEDRTLLLDLEPDGGAGRRAPAVWTASRFLGRQLWLMARQRWHRFGYAAVSFGSPISMHRYLEARDLDLRQLDREARFEQIARLAEHLMDRVGEMVPVVPVALVSTILIERMGQRLSDLDLELAVAERANRLERAGALVYLPRSDREYATEVGLRMLILRRIVVRDEDGYLCARPEEEKILRYYANSILQHRGAEAATPVSPATSAPAAIRH